MKLQDQVTNLELSKKLKELGVKQESLFYWFDHRSMGVDKNGFAQESKHIEWRLINHNGGSETQSLSAFTVAELGEMLPDIVAEQFLDVVKDWMVIEGKKVDCWTYYYSKHETDKVADCIPPFHMSKEHNEANARAKMLIYLLEHKLV